MQRLVTFVMIMFMTLAPVASLSAQVNSVEWINSNASLGNLVEKITKDSSQESAQKNTEETNQQLAKKDTKHNTKHNCCEESQCHCTYQNECDIQNLTFFALSKPQPPIIASSEPRSIFILYLQTFHKPEPSSLYRPPIA